MRQGGAHIRQLLRQGQGQGQEEEVEEEVCREDEEEGDFRPGRRGGEGYFIIGF